MGEQEDIKNDGEHKPGEGGETKAVEPIIVVLKMDLHCEGCSKKVRRSINHFEGVEKVKADCATNKLTVTGNVDPTWLRERVESKTKKKVELVSPQPKKEPLAIAGGGGDKKPNEKSEKKDTEAKQNDDKTPKEPVVNTLVMKIRLHCDRCAHKIKRVVLKNIDGVNSVDTNLEKNLVTVIGTMDIKDLTTVLKEKLKRDVEIISPKKDDGGGDKKANEDGEEKKEKSSGGGGVDGHAKEKEKEKETDGEKKDAETKLAGGGAGVKRVDGPKVEINKLVVHTPNPQTHYAIPIPNQNYVENHQDFAIHMYQNQNYPSSSTGYMMTYPYAHEPSSNTRHMIPYSQGGSPQSGYMPYYPMNPPPPPPTYLNINDQLFSDENPDGCSVM